MQFFRGTVADDKSVEWTCLVIVDGFPPGELDKLSGDGIWQPQGVGFANQKRRLDGAICTHAHAHGNNLFPNSVYTEIVHP